MKHENHLDKTEARWFAVYTRFRREKLVQRILEEKGIEVYLPIQKFTRRYTRKVREVSIPLFSCYVFVKIVQDQYIKVLETENVVRFIQFKKNLIAIPEKEIEIVRRVVGESIPIAVTEEYWQQGDQVEVIAGQLTGLKGKLIHQNGKQKFVIELEKMGYGLQMELDSKYLRKVGAEVLI